MMIGSTLSHYAVEALLGEGGMAAVYRARDTVLHRTVAIKVLPGAGDRESTRRLLREARAACALNHPNIVTIHAVEHEGDTDFIVMEHVAGAPLAVPAGGLPIDRAIDYASQVAAALAAAHDAGIVHRDIKPGNVMIGASGQVKVLDFGIARQTTLPADAVTGQMDATMVASGTIVGTPGYMAPEQIEGRPADARSDVFSLGVVIFEMLTGTSAFAGATTWERMDATVRRELPDVHAVRPETPAALARIVTRSVSKRPEDRYASGHEVRDELLALRASLDGSSRASARQLRLGIAAAVALAVLAGGAFAWSRVRESRLRWARDTAVPEVSRLAAAGELVPAYRLAQRALAAAPDDPQVKVAWNELTTAVPITSEPPGADVALRTYSGGDEGWVTLGTTPTTIRHPVGLMRWRITKEGYDPLEIAPNAPAFLVRLVPKGTTVPGMAYVPAQSLNLESNNTEVKLPAYWIDKYEVTNRAFKQFVDDGGYRRRELWPQPFVKGGRTMSWDEAIAEFRDTTGRSGPSTWELGTYPDGQDDWPVSGVSWYEAAAYAAYVHKRLPTVYHWYNAAGASGVFSEILRFSNFGGSGTKRVGSGGLGPYGTYDMAGNVKEWCWNDVGDSRRYVLGGGFNEASYSFHDQDARPPFERQAGFGFRCIRQDAAVEATLLAPIATLERDPAELKPVGDDVYEAYRHLYEYDALPLDARIEESDESSPHWRRERVSFRAAYGHERVPAQVYIPRNGAPPYQAIIYFPGSDSVRLKSSRDVWLQMVDFLVRSGRVLVLPVYQQTYERHTAGPRYGQNFLREISIQRGQDLRRTVDYLETRADIDRTRIAFYGLSLGAQLGPVYLAIEPRLRTGILMSGGFETWTIPAETDPVNFAPRVRQPVLMVNGREDFDLPYETAQVPLFRMLGTAPSDKRHAVLEGGHLPPRPQEVFKEVLDWLDRYLGPVGSR